MSRPEYGYLSGPGFSVYVESFEQVYAYATAGGVNRAYLYASPGSDVFVGRPRV